MVIGAEAVTPDTVLGTILFEPNNSVNVKFIPGASVVADKVSAEPPQALMPLGDNANGGSSSTVTQTTSVEKQPSLYCNVTV